MCVKYKCSFEGEGRIPRGFALLGKVNRVLWKGQEIFCGDFVEALYGYWSRTRQLAQSRQMMLGTIDMEHKRHCYQLKAQRLRSKTEAVGMIPYLKRICRGFVIFVAPGIEETEEPGLGSFFRMRHFHEVVDC